jgi:hypothetical protein
MVLQAIPNLLNGFSGCSTQMECASKYISDNSATQYAMNKSLHSGGGRSGKTRIRRRGLRLSRYNKIKRGGDDATPVQDYYSCETPDPVKNTIFIILFFYFCIKILKNCT